MVNYGEITLQYCEYHNIYNDQFMLETKLMGK
jgi:hypothetical protein